MQFVYGETTFDVTDEAIIQKLAQRAVNHILGNEAQAAVPKDTEGFEAKRAEWRTNKIAQIVAGQLGVRVGGPRKDPVEAKFDELIVKFVRAQLKSVNLKMPKDGEIVTLPNGQTRTKEQMVARAKETQGTKLRAEAERMVRAEARLMQQAGAEDLGL